MVEYKCFHCGKSVSEDYIRRKVRCPYCGSKMIYKPRTSSTKVKAR
jgi:DNA-directed RNA polymerase subunit P